MDCSHALVASRALQSHRALSEPCRRSGAQAAAAQAFLVDAVAATAQRLNSAGACESGTATGADIVADRPRAAKQAATCTGNGAFEGRADPGSAHSEGTHAPGSGPGSGFAWVSDAELLASTAASVADLAEHLAARAGSPAPGSGVHANAGTGHGSSGTGTTTDGARLRLVYYALLAAGAALTESIEHARLRCGSAAGPRTVGQAADADEWGNDLANEGFQQGFQAAESPNAMPAAEIFLLGGAAEQQAEANGGAGGTHSGTGGCGEAPEGEAALLAARERCLQVARTPHTCTSGGLLPFATSNV